MVAATTKHVHQVDIFASNGEHGGGLIPKPIGDVHRDRSKLLKKAFEVFCRNFEGLPLELSTLVMSILPSRVFHPGNAVPIVKELQRGV